MDRTTPESLGDVLRNLFRESCMDQRLDEYKAINLWSRVVGETIARQCRPPAVTNGVMTVGVPNAALRNELTMNRSGIIREINRILNKEILKDIRFIS